MNIKSKDGTTQSFNIEEVRKLTFSGLVNVENTEKINSALKTFTLMQNYPNPANPTTTIEYQIPEAGNVEVIIYDITGQIVNKLEENFKSAGYYKLNWDGKNNLGQKAASGIYIYRVIYNDVALAKKLMIIK